MDEKHAWKVFKYNEKRRTEKGDRCFGWLMVS